MSDKTIVLQTTGMLSTKNNRRRIFDARASVAISGTYQDAEYVLAPSATSPTMTSTKIIVAMVDSENIKCHITQGAGTVVLDLDDVIILTAPVDAIFFTNSNLTGEPTRVRIIWA